MLAEFNLEFTYEFPKIVMYKYDNGILHYVIKPGIFLTMEDIGEILELFRTNIVQGKYLNLYEFDENSDVDNDVRSWAADDSGNLYTIADAFVLKSLAQKMIADFYLKFHRPAKPTKVFSNTDKAVEWLLKFNDK